MVILSLPNPFMMISNDGWNRKKAVYSGDTDIAESIGKLNDLVIGPDGMVQAAVIGVGGFLGVGQKDVAIAASQLKLSVRSDGNSWLVLNTTKGLPSTDRRISRTVWLIQ